MINTYHISWIIYLTTSSRLDFVRPHHLAPLRSSWLDLLSPGEANGVNSLHEARVADMAVDLKMEYTPNI